MHQLPELDPFVGFARMTGTVQTVHRQISVALDASGVATVSLPFERGVHPDYAEWGIHWSDTTITHFAASTSVQAPYTSHTLTFYAGTVPTTPTTCTIVLRKMPPPLV